MRTHIHPLINAYEQFSVAFTDFRLMDSRNKPEHQEESTQVQ